MRLRTNVGRREQMLRIGTGAIVLMLALRSRQSASRRLLLAAWGVASVATALTRWCPSNALLGIDNSRGHELVHFVGSRRTRRGRLGKRLNRLQHRWGATL